MIYSDEELKRWWNNLSIHEQSEILGLMVQKMEGSNFALSLAYQFQLGKPFSPKQLAAIRKWHHA